MKPNRKALFRAFYLVESGGQMSNLLLDDLKLLLNSVNL